MAAAAAAAGPLGRGQRIKVPRAWHDDKFQVGRSCNKSVTYIVIGCVNSFNSQIFQVVHPPSVK